MLPAIYIVTPVRNAAKTIEVTIWSIVSQLGDFEIYYHIQDGCSTDGTIEIIKRWQHKIEQMNHHLPAKIHFSFATESDTGMYDGINKGFAKLNIPDHAFMGWCNADDALWAGAFQTILSFEKAHPSVEWISGWPTAYDNHHQFVWMERFPFFPNAVIASGLADGIHWPFIQQESTFWKKRLWDKVNGLNASFRLAGDWDLWRRFAEHTELIHIYKQIGAFYIRPGQQSSDLNKYHHEINQTNSLKNKISHFKNLSVSKEKIFSIKIAKEKNNQWILKQHTCKLRARVFFKLCNLMQYYQSKWLFKLLYQIR